MDFHRIVWGKLDGQPVQIQESNYNLTFLPTAKQPLPGDIDYYNCVTQADGTKHCSVLGVAETLNLTNCRAATFSGQDLNCAIPDTFNTEQRKQQKYAASDAKSSKSVSAVFFWFLVFMLLLFLISLAFIYWEKKNRYY